jgi:chaperonin GroES
MKRTIQPKGDRVLIRPLSETETTYGNILIPDLGKERPEIGEVIGVGPGRLSEFGHWIPVNTQVGDKVIIPKIGTIRIELEGEEFYITQEKEILAIINETNE